LKPVLNSVGLVAPSAALRYVPPGRTSSWVNRRYTGTFRESSSGEGSSKLRYTARWRFRSNRKDWQCAAIERVASLWLEIQPIHLL
jgi:hypothetical protein